MTDIKYPEAFDDDSSLPRALDNSTSLTAELFNSLRDAIIQMQRTLGRNPQGSKSTLVDRLDSFLDASGALNITHLNSAGIAKYPIDNSQISAIAGIEESKLNLDYSTQHLMDEISATDSEIGLLNEKINTILQKLNTHISGSAYKHLATDVTFTSGNISGNNVADALESINDNLETHKIEEDSHAAANISISSFSDIAATNVQDALEEVKAKNSEDISLHLKTSHLNGPGIKKYLTEQSKINDACLNVCLFESESATQVIKIGNLNGASFKTKGLKTFGYSASANSVKFTITDKKNSYSLQVTGLQNAEYPSGSSLLSPKALAKYFNVQFAKNANHFPVSAFHKNGELIFQLNYNDGYSSLSIEEPSSNSAITLLGLSDIVGVQHTCDEEINYAVLGEQIYDEIPVFASGEIEQISGSNILNLGVDTSDLLINSLIHVFNHDTHTNNGTYRITEIAPASASPSTSIRINAVIGSGTFEYAVYKDSHVASLAGTYDLYYEDSITSSLIYEDNSVLSGLKIVDVSHGFKDNTGTIAISKPSDFELALTVDGYTGQSTSIINGSVGFYKLFHPNANDYLLCEVTSSNPPYPLSDTFTTYSYIGNNKKTYLSSFYYDGTSSYILGERTVGELPVLTKENSMQSGVLHGFTVTQVAGPSIFIEGGEYYVGFKKYNANSTNITLSTNGTYNIYLDKDSIIKVVLNSKTGFDVASIYSREDFLLIGQVTLTSGSISDLKDYRFFISNQDTNAAIIVESSGRRGSVASLQAAANLISLGDTRYKNNIIVADDYTINTSVSLSNVSVKFLKDLNNAASLTFTDSTVDFDGYVTLTAAITNNSSCFNFNNSLFGASHISIEDSNSSLYFSKDSKINKINLASGISGLVFTGNGSAITFDGTDNGITCDGYIDNLFIQNLNLKQDLNVAYSIINITYLDGLYLNKCTLSYTTDLTTVTIASGVKTGISCSILENSFIDSCVLYNLKTAISAETLQKCKITNSIFNKTGTATTATTSINNNILNNLYLENHTASFVSASSLSDCFSNNIFDANFATTSRPKFLDIADGYNLSFCGNVLKNTDTNLAFNFKGANCNIAGNIFSTTNVNSTDKMVVIEVLSGYEGVFSNNVLLSKGSAGSFKNVNMNGNVFYYNSTALGSSALTITNSLTATKQFTGNYIKGLSSYSFVVSGDYNISGNYFEGNLLTVNSGGRDFTFSNNYIKITGTSGTSTIGLKGGRDVIFSNNFIDSTGTGKTITDTCVNITYSGNYIKAPSSTSNIVHSSTDSKCIFVNNAIFGTATNTNMILIDAPTALVNSNFLSGAANTSVISFSDASATVVCTGNFTSVSGSGGNTISAVATDNTFICFNKNIDETYTVGIGASLRDGNWTDTLSSLTFSINSGSGTNYLGLVLPNLPTGSRLVSAGIKCEPTGANAVNIRLVKRASNSSTYSNIGSAAGVSTTSSALVNLSISPTSTTYIDSGGLSDYSLLIKSSTVSNKIFSAYYTIRR